MQVHLVGVEAGRLHLVEVVEEILQINQRNNTRESVNHLNLRKCSRRNKFIFVLWSFNYFCYVGRYHIFSLKREWQWMEFKPYCNIVLCVCEIFVTGNNWINAVYQLMAVTFTEISWLYTIFRKPILVTDLNLRLFSFNGHFQTNVKKTTTFL